MHTQNIRNKISLAYIIYIYNLYIYVAQLFENESMGFLFFENFPTKLRDIHLNIIKIHIFSRKERAHTTTSILGVYIR